jgi:hypothetical protein
MSALFAGILVQPPYLWSFNALGYVFLGQIATAVAVPFFCGYLSDIVVRIMSKRNNGIAEVSEHIFPDTYEKKIRQPMEGRKDRVDVTAERWSSKDALIHLLTFHVCHQPEYRLLALIIPFIAMIISTVLYGQTAQTPTEWSWTGIAVGVNFEYFGFVGVVVSSFVYSMDA